MSAVPRPTSSRRRRPTASAPAGWNNRIVSFDPAVDPEQLLANPANWRIHTLAQRAALEGVLDSVGWVAPVIVNVQTSHTVDGHQRIESAITKGEKVPVVYIDVTEDEEKAILATFDPIGALAGRDAAKHDALLAEMRETHATLAQLLADAQALTHAGPTRQDGDVPAGDAANQTVTSQFMVIVTCSDEAAQVALLERLATEGYACRAIVS